MEKRVNGQAVTEEQVIAQLAAAVEQKRSGLEAVNNDLNGLKQQRSDMLQAVASAEADLEKLRQEQSVAIEQLAKAKRDEANLQIRLSEQMQRLDSEQQKMRRSMEREISTLAAGLDQARIAADQGTAECEVALASLSAARDKSNQLTAETEARHQLLRDEFDQISRRMTEAVKAAGVRSSIAHIEKEAAETSLRLAEKALADITAALAETDADIVSRQNALDSLYKLRKSEDNAIRQRNSNALAAAQAAEEALANQHRNKQEAVEKARSLAAMASNALAASEESLLKLTEELKDLYLTSEQEAVSLADRMEAILKHAVSERQSYIKILAVADSVREQAQEAEERENELTDRVNALRREDQNLRNAALVSRNLAADATLAKANASEDMFRQVEEMERALIAAADEAEHLSAAKETELLEAQNALSSILGLADRKRQAAAEAQKLLSESEKNCQLAEQEMLDISAQMENSGAVADPTAVLIAEKRAAYEEEAARQAELKEAAYVAGNNLRLIKSEAEKVERNYVSAARDTAQLLASCEKEALESDERIASRISEAKAMLDIVRDKREKIYRSQTEKKQAVDKCQDLLQLKTDISAAAQSEYHDAQSETEKELHQLREKLDNSIKADLAGMADTQQAAAAAAQAYDQALLRSIKSADNIIVMQDELAKHKKYQEQLLSTQALEQEAAEQQSRQQAGEMAAVCQELEEKLNSFTNPLRLSQLDRDQKYKESRRLLAACELTEDRAKRLTAELAACEKEHGAVCAAAAIRFAEQAEKQRVAEARQQARRAEEEEEHRVREQKEKTRVANELEAARIMAEAETARIAVEETAKQAAAENEAVRLLAGDILTREDNLALISSGQLRERMGRIAELAREDARVLAALHHGKAEKQRFIDEARAAAGEAAEHRRLFGSAQTTLVSLTVQLEEKQAQRKQYGRELARYIAALDHASYEHDALAAACRETERAGLTGADNSYKLLNRAMRHLRQALNDNNVIIESNSADLRQLQEKVNIMDADIDRARRERAEAENLLAELTALWLYKESRAIRTMAKVEALNLSIEPDRDEDEAPQVAEFTQRRADQPPQGKEGKKGKAK